MHALLAAAVVVLAGHVLDRTTGQPLPGVHVVSGAISATTDAGGRFTLRGLHAGPNGVTLESDDVPQQQYRLRLGPGTTRRDFRACSTTLDYSCAKPGGSPGAGAGAG